MTIEKKAADTILRKNKVIKMGRRAVRCKPITLSTFVAVSAITSEFPKFDVEIERTDNEILSFVLTEAGKYGRLGELIAVLAYGEPRKGNFIKRWRRNRLAKYITHDVPAAELGKIINQLLDGLSIAHFFQCTASLSELNILKGKRQVILSGDK